LRRIESYQSKEPLIQFYSTSGISSEAQQAAEKGLNSVQFQKNIPQGLKPNIFLIVFRHD